MRSLRACHVQASVWPRDCWRKSGMIAVATSRPAVCKLWEELRPCSFKVACTPKRIVDWAASNRCAMPCSNLPGRARKVSRGPGTITSANEQKEKAIPWRYEHGECVGEDHLCYVAASPMLP